MTRHRDKGGEREREREREITETEGQQAAYRGCTQAAYGGGGKQVARRMRLAGGGA